MRSRVTLSSKPVGSMRHRSSPQGVLSHSVPRRLPPVSHEVLVANRHWLWSDVWGHHHGGVDGRPQCRYALAHRCRRRHFDRCDCRRIVGRLRHPSGRGVEGSCDDPSCLSTFVAKLITAGTFAIPVLLFELPTSILVSILWGLVLLTALTSMLARQQGLRPWRAIGEHVLVAAGVVMISYYVGHWARGLIE